MKTEIIKNYEHEEELLNYPCLMINEEHGLIVLATGYSHNGLFEGILLKNLNKTDKHSYMEVGRQDSWNLKVFKHFTDKLVLSNEEIKND